jgi:hypothetical protein
VVTGWVVGAHDDYKKGLYSIYVMYIGGGVNANFVKI